MLVQYRLASQVLTEKKRDFDKAMAQTLRLHVLPCATKLLSGMHAIEDPCLGWEGPNGGSELEAIGYGTPRGRDLKLTGSLGQP